jgi:hypothetical protein
MRRIRSYFAETAVDRLILFNAGVIEYGAAFYAARAEGVNVIEWEQSAHRRGSYVLSVNRPHGAFDLREVWRRDAPHELDDARRQRVGEWMRQKDPRTRLDPEPRGRHVLDTEAQALLRELGLDPAKPVAALFPNLTWDTSALDRDRAFASVADWVLRTADYFVGHPEWQLVVRSHPAERVRSEEHVGALLRARWPTLPVNIRIVESESPLSSYRLLDASQLGLYYTGTLGIEMAMAGIQAITPALPLFGGLGFTRETESANDYFAAIAAAFADPDGTAMTAAEMALAWCFADLYMSDVPKDLPWSYQRFWPSILEDWPMQRVLGADGACFDRVFAIFGGEVDLPDGVVGALDKWVGET